jgi:hypothetical protein
MFMAVTFDSWTGLECGWRVCSPACSQRWLSWGELIATSSLCSFCAGSSGIQPARCSVNDDGSAKKGVHFSFRIWVEQG